MAHLYQAAEDFMGVHLGSAGLRMSHVAPVNQQYVVSHGNTYLPTLRREASIGGKPASRMRPAAVTISYGCR